MAKSKKAPLQNATPEPTPEEIEERAAAELGDVEEIIAGLAPGAREFALVEVRRLWFAAQERHRLLTHDDG